MYGAVCMLTGIGALTVNDALAKWLTQSYPVGEVIGLRGVLILCLILGFARLTGRMPALRVTSWRLQLARGGAMAISTYTFIWGLHLMPMANANAIAFAGPIITAALAAPLLGEQVGWRRWTAILVGFAGVMVMIKPTPAAFSAVVLLPLVATLFGSLRDLVTRLMHRTETSLSMLFVSVAIVTASGFVSWFVGDWAPLEMRHVPLFLASSLLVGVAQFLMIEAFRFSEAAVVSPLKYSSMIWAVLIGYLVWGDVPDAWIVGGSALVAGSGLYILHRERLHRRAADAEAARTTGTP